MSDHHASINGHLLRVQRETRGWTMTDLAVRSCLSIKQIRQLEEGGSESFYSDAVKLTAAKKVAALLGLSIEQVLGQPPRALSSSIDESLQPSTLAPDLNSGEPHQIQEASSAAVHAPIASTAPTMPTQPELADTKVVDAPKSRLTSLWVMAVLFAAALLVAAWLNPSAESAVTEAEPPVQTLPVEVSDAANALAETASNAATTDALNSVPVASQARVIGVQAASLAASSPSVRASDAAEAASH